MRYNLKSSLEDINIIYIEWPSEKYGLQFKEWKEDKL